MLLVILYMVYHTSVYIVLKNQLIGLLLVICIVQILYTNAVNFNPSKVCLKFRQIAIRRKICFALVNKTVDTRHGPLFFTKPCSAWKFFDIRVFAKITF
jgi:hypothetical protein